MEFNIPIVNESIDTDDPAESAQNFGGAVLGFTALAGAAGVSTYLYTRLKNVAGVEGQTFPEGI
ncbi:hypothetical protein [Halobacterium litoreum]|uniref:Sugar kinase n=1 Tax=Halobacterium litoreum TaxID=2039234 RepID=A0ABD5NAQ3_9EURY|nr:hypothetical protein [Halobacterium litoreum]UHH14866.1 hypothetical protein LT972_14765 [Halobacterium litoreum]